MLFSVDAPWTVEFDESGGYDCMSSAYKIKGASGRTLFVVDTADFNTDAKDWESRHTTNKDAENVANIACAASKLILLYGTV